MMKLQKMHLTLTVLAVTLLLSCGKQTTQSNNSGSYSNGALGNTQLTSTNNGWFGAPAGMMGGFDSEEVCGRVSHVSNNTASTTIRIIDIQNTTREYALIIPGNLSLAIACFSGAGAFNQNLQYTCQMQGFPPMGHPQFTTDWNAVKNGQNIMCARGRTYTNQLYVPPYIPTNVSGIFQLLGQGLQQVIGNIGVNLQANGAKPFFATAIDLTVEE
ncbi:MAG: hypothetical protein KBD63_03035 [Bacteriovoracaceae bacterium]|nr:hypothetical protein [Bacteriovoracaceae bacterium]